MMLLSDHELHNFLDLKFDQYCRPSFIESDPISIPHSFTRKEDIEISGFLTATIAWGNRTSIIRDARRLMAMMEESPFEFVMNASDANREKVMKFYHRTFCGEDTAFFLEGLRYCYREHGGLEPLFIPLRSETVYDSILRFRKTFLSLPHPGRVEKHLPNPASGSAAKRLLMFLRWMVRNDGRGVDFGLWKSIDPAHLMCPLDVHSGRVARKLGLLKRKANDWKAVTELTEKLKQFDPADSVKYDFALFGLGIFENF